MRMKLLGLFTLIYLAGISITTISATDENCGEGHMKCNITRKCVPLSWKCDGDTDCGQDDDTDEAHCGPKTCATDEMQCKTDGSCVSARWVCDGEPDCEDGSDEEKCASENTCQPDEYLCKDRTCITKVWLCDGSKDCTDGDDEHNCNNTCGTGMFTCKSNNFCVSETWKCDGDSDCLDGSDEDGCDEKTCKSEEFLCADKSRCIDREWYCDGDFDCGDHSDELGCESPTNGSVICSSNDFRCKSGEECIHRSWMCDGGLDCTDGSDENDKCNYTCREEQFKCKNNFCIAESLHCDGSSDCMDGSDEEGCASQSCVEKGMFDCHITVNDSLCILNEKVCDSTRDCPHNEDEDPELCKQVNPCKDKSCGHHSHCVNIVTSSGKKEASCVCDAGYHHINGTENCKDIDECAERGRCSQICINEIGSYKCGCHEGYILEKHYFCRADGEKPWLYYANRHDIRRLRIDSRYMETVVEHTGNSIALDIDFKNGVLFWTDSSEKTINSGKIGQTEDILVFDTKAVFTYKGTNTFAPEGLAVDWLHKNLYWTNTGDDTITVTNYNGDQTKALITKGLDEPRSIAVDPEHGYMYWTDWGQKPKIERAGMDGTAQETICENDLEWPNGIAVDYVARRVYWIDAKLKTIESANVDGTDRIIVLKDPVEIQKPYGISVFEDSVYYTDWDTNSIRSVNKVSGQHAQTLSLGSFSVMDIKVYHEKKQNLTLADEISALCAKCDSLCVAKPRVHDSQVREVECLCGDHWCAITQPPRQVETTTVAPNTAAIETTAATTNNTESVPQAGEKAQSVGTIAIIAGVVAFAVIVVVLIVIVVTYKRMQARNKKSMNFDNPVYRKTTTTDDSCMIHHDDDLARTMEPLTTHHETA